MKASAGIPNPAFDPNYRPDVDYAALWRERRAALDEAKKRRPSPRREPLNF